MKQPKRSTRKEKAQPQEILEQQYAPLTTKRNQEPLVAKTPAQKRYIAAMKSHMVVFGIGPAGTGKTYIAGSIAAQMLESDQVEKIIITRPAVEAGESMGFLPGELAEKYEPYIAPFREVLNERLGKSTVDYLIKVGRIEPAPLAYMRGRTFKNAMVILDEAQNTTPKQMKMFLTRIGEGCHVVVDGDPLQADLPGMSGLVDAIARLSHIPAIKVIKFTRDDIVRSGLVGEVANAYEVAIPGLNLAVI